MLLSKNDKRYAILRETLIVARKKQQLHQSNLAKKLGVTQQFISKIETGERQLDFIEAIEIAYALSIDIHALIRKLQSD